VILPGVGYPPRRDDPKLLLWLERTRGHAEPDLLLAPIREAAAEADGIYEYLKQLESAKEEHETARLLYVAATRAKRSLHLIGQVDWKEGRIVRPRARSLLDHLWPVVSGEFERVAAQGVGAPDEAGLVAEPPRAIRRFASAWRSPVPPAGLDWKAPDGPGYEGKHPHDEVEFSWASETARHAGTIVHRFLQFIAREGLEQWDARRVGRMHEVYARDLARLGVPESERLEAVARVANALVGAVAGERGRWVLGAHEDARSELRLTGVIGGEIASVAMDRTFVDGTGTRWIVDYKTGMHEGGDIEAFLHRERERYRPQLERYAKLMRELEDRPIRLGIYFPLLDGWREWKYSPADDER
jgi:hypothetical protein